VVFKHREEREKKKQDTGKYEDGKIRGWADGRKFSAAK
jgi:hypothetical protein